MAAVVASDITQSLHQLMKFDCEEDREERLKVISD